MRTILIGLPDNVESTSLKRIFRWPSNVIIFAFTADMLAASSHRAIFQLVGVQIVVLQVVSNVAGEFAKSKALHYNMLDAEDSKRSSETPDVDDSHNKRQRIHTNLGTEVDEQLNAILGANEISELEGVAGNNQDQGELDIDFDNLPADLLQKEDTQPDLALFGSNYGTSQPTVKTETSTRVPSSQQTNRPTIKPAVPSAPVILTNSGPVNRMNPLVQQATSIQGLNTSSIDHRPGTSAQQSGGAGQEKFHTNDPSKLNDALAAAGVDIGREEELLQQQQYNRGPRINVLQPSYIQQRTARPIHRTPFLNPYHLGTFMQRVARENGVLQSFMSDNELLELMSASCEQWISHIATKTILLSRHRRRGIPALKNKKIPSNQIPRSEVSKELRSLALRQKEIEERRVSRRILLGLENKDANLESNKVGAEETLHRAANETAAMMTSNKKKYLWMSSGAGTGDDTKAMEREKDKQSHLLALRGDNGLRFRDIRTGDSITMKDILSALEDERMGVNKAIMKGYARLKD